MHAQSCQEKVVPHWATGSNLRNRRQYYWISPMYVGPRMIQRPSGPLSISSWYADPVQMDDVFLLVAHVICKQTPRRLYREESIASELHHDEGHTSISRLHDHEREEKSWRGLKSLWYLPKADAAWPSASLAGWGADGLADWRRVWCRHSRSNEYARAAGSAPVLHLRWVLLSFSLALERGNNLQQTSDVAVIEFLPIQER